MACQPVLACEPIFIGSMEQGSFYSIFVMGGFSNILVMDFVEGVAAVLQGWGEEISCDCGHGYGCGCSRGYDSGDVEGVGSDPGSHLSSIKMSPPLQNISNLCSRLKMATMLFCFLSPVLPQNG